METKLKTLYDGMSIVEIEKMAMDYFHQARENRKSLIDVLIYLKVSSRYKENHRYAKESFWTYISDVYSMRPGTFIELQRVWTTFPKEAVEYSEGLVAKTLRIVDALNVKKVFAEIEKLKGGNLLDRRAKVDKIIEKYKNPKKEKIVHDWKALYEKEVMAHEATKAAYKEAMARIAELEEQNDKLKKTARIIVDIRKAMKGHEVVAAI